MAPPRKKKGSLSRSAKYYRDNPEARKKKAATDKKINKRPAQKAKRRKLGTANYAHDKKHGKSSREGKDLSHTKSGLKYKDSSNNRGSKSDTSGDKKARGKKK
tara:strand:+ start:21292 stop:21600 length:309 start_codon:yes stop_codon:yes gene_type:complete